MYWSSNKWEIKTLRQNLTTQVFSVTFWVHGKPNRETPLDTKNVVNLEELTEMISFQNSWTSKCQTLLETVQQ